MNKGDVFSGIVKSWNILKENYKVIWIVISVEILFFILFGFVYSPLYTGMQNNLENLGGEIIQNSENIDNIANQATNSVYFRNILILGVVLAIIVYILYCIFQGFLWRFSFNLTEKKKRFLPYIKRFFLVNILWYVLFIIYVLINFFFLYVDTVGRRLEPEGTFFLGGLSNVMLIIIAYFAFISYVKIEKLGVWKSIRESFRIGFKKAGWMTLCYMIIGIAFIIVNYALYFLERLNFVVFLFMGIVLIMPLLLIARIFIKLIVEKL
jgi:hypothetical protein